jgi:hypothetical protein
MKTTQNREKLVSIGITGVADISYPLIRFIGISQLFGVLGITLPWALMVFPALTPLTASCFAMIMVMAAPIHFKRKEYLTVVFVNILFLVISVFVAYMRSSQLIELDTISAYFRA